MKNHSYTQLNNIIQSALSTVPVTETDEVINWFSNDLNKNTKPLKAKDPFAAAVCSWREWKTETGYRWKTLEECTPTAEDHALAKEMCVYYRDKVGMRALLGTQMSQFQQTLYSILVQGHTELQECHRGMLHRLPYFYAEDLTRKELLDRFSGVMTLKTKPYSLPDLEIDRATKYLTPVTRLISSRKSSETVEYWFTDDQGQPVLFKMIYNAALRKMFDGLFKLPGVKLTGHYRIAQLRLADFAHFMINDPELVFD